MLSRLHRPGLAVLAAIFLLEVPVATIIGPAALGVPPWQILPGLQQSLHEWGWWATLLIALPPILASYAKEWSVRRESVRNVDEMCPEDLPRRVQARVRLYRLVPAAAPAAAAIVPTWSACWSCVSTEKNARVAFLLIGLAVLTALLAALAGARTADAAPLSSLLEQLATPRTSPHRLTARACEYAHAQLLLSKAGLRADPAATTVALALAKDSPDLALTDVIAAANGVTSTEA